MRHFMETKPYTFGWLLGYLISILVGLIAWFGFDWPYLAVVDLAIAGIVAYVMIAVVIVKAFREWR